MSLTQRVLKKSKFYGYRKIFHRQVEANPIKCELVKVAVSPSNPNDALSNFMGASDRTEISKELRCLYDLNAVSKSREDFGIREDTEAVIIISPISLMKAYNVKKLEDTNSYYVVFRGEKYVISYDRYLEEMFGDSVAIMLELKTARRGGS